MNGWMAAAAGEITSIQLRTVGGRAAPPTAARHAPIPLFPAADKLPALHQRYEATWKSRPTNEFLNEVGRNTAQKRR
jgi:hypothetical protein